MSDIGIPKFYDFMAPIWRYCGDGKEHTLTETIDKMASEFRLTEDQKNTLMPSGKRTYVYERISWAITYLVKAGVLERTGRSKFRIKDLGLSEIKNLPEKISYAYLLKYPSFVKLKERSHKKENEKGASHLTPDEQIDNLFRTRNEILIDSIISRISNIKPSDFERLIIDVVLSLGYGKNTRKWLKF